MGPLLSRARAQLGARPSAPHRTTTAWQRLVRLHQHITSSTFLCAYLHPVMFSISLIEERALFSGSRGGRACELCSWAFRHFFCQWYLGTQQSDSDMKNTDHLPAEAVLLAVLAAACAVGLGVTACSTQTSTGTYLQEMQASENKTANLLQGMNDRACSVASVVQLYWRQDSPQMSGNAGINLTLMLYFADGWPHSREQPTQALCIDDSCSKRLSYPHPCPEDKVVFVEIYNISVTEPAGTIIAKQLPLHSPSPWLVHTTQCCSVHLWTVRFPWRFLTSWTEPKVAHRGRMDSASESL